MYNKINEYRKFYFAHLKRISSTTSFVQLKSLGLVTLLLYLVVHPDLAHSYSKVDAFENFENNEKETFETRFIKSNIKLTNWFNSITNKIDHFLVGQQIQNEKNESSVKIENSTYSVERKGVSNQTAFIISPRFPNFEKYWNLKFTTFDDQAVSRSAQKSLTQSSPHETNYGASIGFFKKIGKIRTSFQPRIELQNPLKVSHSLAFDSRIDFIDFELYPKLEFFAHATNGTGLFQAFNFNFILTDVLSLTLINEGTYEEKKNKYFMVNGFSLNQFISSKNSLSYNLLFASHNRDNYHLDMYTFAVTWYHIFYRKILDLQITPHIDFTEQLNFKGESGLTLRLTLSF